jgi:hypothetical protein
MFYTKYVVNTLLTTEFFFRHKDYSYIYVLNKESYILKIMEECVHMTHLTLLPTKVNKDIINVRERGNLE